MSRLTQVRAPKQPRSIIVGENTFLKQLRRGGGVAVALVAGVAMLTITMKEGLRLLRPHQPLGSGQHSDHSTTQHFNIRVDARYGARILVAEGECFQT